MKTKFVHFGAAAAGALSCLAGTLNTAFADQAHGMPGMDAERGRALFVEKGCYTCHAVNGVGGDHASPLDAHGLDDGTGPFGLFARMWQAAPAMIAAQEAELGARIELTGDELAQLFAFLLDHDAQHHFSVDNLSAEQVEAMQAHHGAGHDHAHKH